jgi:8-oxo-dGTP diphosphatase
MPFRNAATVNDVNWPRWTPVDVATLMFVMRGDEVLLIRKKRGLGKGLINAPGGRVDPGETPLQAAVRELSEEVCLAAQEPAFCGEHRFQFRDGYSMHVHVYCTNRYTGEATETDEALPLWFKRDAIPYEEMWADDVHWVPLLLRGELFETRSIFDGEKMIDFEMTKTGRR